MAEANPIPADCRIRLRGASARALRDLNQPLAPFLEAGETAGITATIGPFTPDPAGTSNVDRQYYARRDYLYFRESVGGLELEAEIRGLEGDRTEVKLHAAKRSWSTARLLYPDAVLQTLVLLPLLERKLARRGLFLVHAGGVAKDGQAVILAGRGGSFKTTFCFRLVREGWSFLGDDLLLFDSTRVYPLPLHPAYFDYYLRAGLESETEMNLFNKARLAVRLVGRPEPAFPLADPSSVKRLVILDPRVGENPSCHPLPLPEAAERARLNTRLERYADLPDKYIAGAFLDAYLLMFPETPLKDPHGEAWSAAFRSLCSGASCHRSEIGKAWRHRYLEVLQGIV